MQNNLENFLKISGAINDESRVLILAFLKQHGELCVCDLQSSLGMIQSRLSRHLKILKDAGFLSLQRKGVWAYYKIHEKPQQICQILLDSIEALNLILPPLKLISCINKDKK